MQSRLIPALLYYKESERNKSIGCDNMQFCRGCSVKADPVIKYLHFSKVLNHTLKRFVAAWQAQLFRNYVAVIITPYTFVPFTFFVLQKCWDETSLHYRLALKGW